MGLGMIHDRSCSRPATRESYEGFLPGADLRFRKHCGQREREINDQFAHLDPHWSLLEVFLKTQASGLPLFDSFGSGILVCTGYKRRVFEEVYGEFHI